MVLAWCIDAHRTQEAEPNWQSSNLTIVSSTHKNAFSPYQGIVAQLI